MFLSLLIGFVLFRPEKKISEVSKIRSFLSFTLITILFTSAAITPLSIASNYWNSVSADEMNATESVTSPGSTETEPATAVQPTESSNPNEPSTPTSEEPASADISATTTPVGNSTTTVPASDSTTTTVLAGNSTSSDELTSQTESVHDNSTSNEITQPLPDATLSLQFDDSDTQASDVAGDATVEEKLDVASLNLDGEGDFVQVTDTGSRELTAISLSAWVKPDYSGGSSEFTVVSKDKAFVLAINNNIPPYKVAKFSVFDGIKWSTVESTTQIGEEWTHLAATFDGSSVGIHVNGNLESTLPIIGIPSLTVNGQLQLTTVDSISSDSDIVIGAYLSEKSGHGETSNQFSGLVDDVHLYDSLLESTQISEIYNQNIISYYSSEEIEDFTLTHDTIEIGKPVTWTQSIVIAEQTESVAVEVPADAQILQVETSTDGNVDLATIETITSSAVLDNEVPLASLDLVPEMVQEDKPTEFVVINEAATGYTITFETPAPYAIEEDQSTPELYSKEVTVAHDSTLHYTDVKSYSDIPEDLVAQGIPFKLYWIIDGERTDVTADPRFAVEFVDTNGNGMADQMQWIVPQLSEQVFVIEAAITIINVQSYPTVGGNWTVRFTTVGSGDLVITAIDGTTFGELLPADLKFLELNNGTHTLTPTIEGNSIIYHDYSSMVEGSETSQVLTAGQHHLEFRFGNDVKYANNLAGNQDAIAAYRSDQGSDNTSAPKIRFWDSSGTGTWSSATDLLTAGSPIKYLVVKHSPINERIVLVTESNDGRIDAYICNSGCEQRTNWTVRNDIGQVTPVENVKRFDVEFETSTGDAIVVYGKGVSNPTQDLGYRILPSASTNFNPEVTLDDTGHNDNIVHTWPTLSRNPVSTSQEIILAVFDSSHDDINGWVWDGNSWGNRKELTNDATHLGRKQGLDVRYASDGSKAMVVGGHGNNGEVRYMTWASSSWSSISSFDMDPTDSSDVRWLTLSADPSTDDLQLVAIDSSKDLHTAYWNGATWTVKSNIDTSVDSGQSSKIATFAWKPTGNTGQLVWDTDKNNNKLSQMTCSPQCNSAISQISFYGGTGRWLDSYTNPDSADTVKILSLRHNSRENIGSFSWDGSTYVNYGDDKFTSDTDGNNYPFYSLDFKPTVNAPTNHPPVLVAIGNKVVNELLLLSFDADATDPDLPPQTLTFSLSEAPVGASINPITGLFTWIPTEAQGPDVYLFKVIVTDSGSPPLSDIEEITVTVNEVNTAPVATDDAYSTDEDTQLNVAAPGVLDNDEDVDGNPLTAVLVLGPSHGTLTLNSNGGFTYDPDANYNGPDNFTYRAYDGTVFSNIATVNITVNPVNDALLDEDDAYSTDEDTQLNVAAPGVLDNDEDVDGDELIALLVSDPSHGTLTLNEDGSFEYMPEPDFNGQDSFQYKANDGELEENTATVTITVNPIDDVPVAVDDEYEVDEDDTLQITAPGVLGNDINVDGDSLTALLVSEPSSGSLSFNVFGSFVYIPNVNFYGTDSFTYKVNDGTSDSNVAIVTITVDSVNDLPVAFDDEYSTEEDTLLVIGVPSGTLANDADADGDPLTAELVDDVDHGTLTLNAGGGFTYTPEMDFNGFDSFTYHALDDELASSNTATVIINVGVENDSPVALDDSYEVVEDTTLVVSATGGVLANDDDPDEDALTTILLTPPLFGSVAFNSDGSFTYTPNPNFNGIDLFTYQANDLSDNSNVATVTLSVGSVNDSPIAFNDVYSTDEDTLLTVTASLGVLGNDVDVDDTLLTASLVDDVGDGTLTFNSDGSFEYIPDADFTGIDSFTYVASDGVSSSTLGTVTINVGSANDPPIAADDTYSVDEDTVLTIDAAEGVLNNDVDVDEDPLVIIQLLPTSGSLSLDTDDGSFVYTPDPNFYGTDSFTYQDFDGLANSNVATVVITVNPVNDAPVAVNDAYSTAEDTPLIVPPRGVLRNDADVDGDPLTAELVDDVDHGTLTLNAGGGFTYTPETGYDGPDSFEYNANDGTADSNTATVSITVIPTSFEGTIELPPPVIEQEQLDDIGATDADGNPLTELPPVNIVSDEDAIDDAIANTQTIVVDIADDLPPPPPDDVISGTDVIDTLGLPTYNLPPIAGITSVIPPVTDVTNDGAQLVATPPVDNWIPGQNVIIPVNPSTLPAFGGLTQMEVTPSLDTNTENGEATDWFVMQVFDTIPPSLPPLPTTDEEEPVSLVDVFIDVSYAFEETGIGTDWSNPDSFAQPPRLTLEIPVPGLDYEGALTSEGCAIVEAFAFNTATSEWEELVIISNTRNGLFCSVLLEGEHFSKFAIGGVKALLGATLLGGSSNNVPPSVVTVTLGGNDQSSSTDTTVIGFGGRLQTGSNLTPGTFKTGEPVKLSSSKIVKTGDPLTLKLILQEEEGAPAIAHVAFYVNLLGNEPQVDKSDTYVIYEKSKPITVVDPHGFFSEVNVAISQIDAVTLALTYDIKFAKPMAKSDIIIRSWDIKRNVDDTKILDALEVVEPGAIPHTIPSWVKNNANWWSSGQIGDSDFVQGVQHLIKEGIITIPETKAGSDSSQQIPTWIKNNAGWWAEGLISDDDFISAIQWLITNGIMKV